MFAHELEQNGFGGDLTSIAEQFQKYRDRNRVLIITTKDETFEYKPPTLHSRAIPEVDTAIKKYLFEQVDEFSIIGKLTKNSRLTWLGLEWNGDPSRSEKVVRGTFSKTAKNIPELVLIEVFDCDEIDQVATAKREEILTIRDNKIVRRETDLSLREIFELAKSEPGYNDRTRTFEFLVDGNRYPLLLGNNPDKATYLFYEALKEVGQFSVKTTLPSNGLLQFFRVINAFGASRGEESGVFYFTRDRDDFVCAKAEYLCVSPELEGRVAFTHDFERKCIISELSFEELVKEVSTRAKLKPEYKESYIQFNGSTYQVFTTTSRRTSLERCLFELIGNEKS